MKVSQAGFLANFVPGSGDITVELLGIDTSIPDALIVFGICIPGAKYEQRFLVAYESVQPGSSKTKKS